MSAFGGKAEHSEAIYVCFPSYNTLAILDAIRRDIAPTRLVTTCFCASQICTIASIQGVAPSSDLSFFAFLVYHVHSSWHCCCWASAIEGIAASPTATTTFFSMVASLIKDATHEASSL